jgi:GT2 family glycosyltransferase
MIRYRQFEDLFHIFIIDNGVTPCRKYLSDKYDPFITIIREGRNLGWEGGLLRGLKEVPKEVEFIMFANDDIFIPASSRTWLNDMLQWMKYPEVAAVGPTSNVVMGLQNIFTVNNFPFYSTAFLIGFCVLLRKEALEKVGGIDVSNPNCGDDLDLSIRLRDAGYKLVVDKNVFVYHHGFKTGERLYGTSKTTNGWNSYEQYQRTILWLIKKHGFARWQRLMLEMNQNFSMQYKYPFNEDSEGNLIRKMVHDEDKKIYELGCGNLLTVPQAIGVDMVPKGELIGSLGQERSVAEITADVSQELPFKDADLIIARHVLEHCIDTVTTLKYWHKVIRIGGRLIIAVPDEEMKSTISVNKEHVHAFTQQSLTHLMELVGFRNIKTMSGENNVSFIAEAYV